MTNCVWWVVSEGETFALRFENSYFSDVYQLVQNKRTQSDQTVDSIGIVPITQLYTCVIKIVTFKGGQLMWLKLFSIL